MLILNAFPKYRYNYLYTSSCLIIQINRKKSFWKIPLGKPESENQNSMRFFVICHCGMRVRVLSTTKQLLVTDRNANPKQFEVTGSKSPLECSHANDGTRNEKNKRTSIHHKLNGINRWTSSILHLSFVVVTWMFYLYFYDHFMHMYEKGNFFVFQGGRLIWVYGAQKSL